MPALVSKGKDFFGLPAIFMAVRHPQTDGKSAHSLGEAICLLERIQRIADIVSSGNPQKWHLRATQIDRRIPELQPLLFFFAAELLEGRNPKRILTQETTAIYWNGKAKSRIDACGDRA